MNNSRIFLPVYVLLVLISINSTAQNKPESSEETTSAIPDIEKVYLHTDRSYYSIGETLWYKAYMVYAFNNQLFDNSKILYVELIDAEAKIIARNKTRLESGLGHGDFQLNDSINVAAGKYQLRAYTNWMRNFGDDFLFEKEIEIFDITKQEGEDTEIVVQDKKNKKDRENEVAITTAFEVQFFPEGGSLLEDVSCAVAFKATDNNGLPIEIQGQILDENDKQVAILKTVHDGMGKFVLSPLADKTYKAKIKNAQGDSIIVDLPLALKQGYLLNMMQHKGKHIVSIKTNEQTLNSNPDAPITIIATSKGVTYFEGTQPLSQTKLSFELPQAEFPEGITQVTLYKESIPQSERLVYIEKSHDLDIKATPSKSSYTPKEEVAIAVSSKNGAGESVFASYSLAVTDVNGVEESNHKSGSIASYFLMESDIRGKVYNPGNYFDSSNPNRLRELDLLLLTQGWRNFIWEKLPKIKDGKQFKVENGIRISGTVKDLFSEKPKPNSQVSLALINNGKHMMLFDETGADGRFNFEDIVFSGKSTMMLNTQNEKGKNRGMFLLDSIFENPLDVSFKPNYKITSEAVKSIKEKVYEKHIAFGVSPENVLDEVEITAKKKEVVRSKYGNADRVYVPDDKQQSFSNIYMLIQYAIPGVTVIKGSVGFNRYGGRPALIVIDDTPTEMSDLGFVQPDDVAKIESMNSSSAAIFGSQGGNGVILVYTKEGTINKKSKKKFHSIVEEIDGFHKAKVFYVPSNEEEDFESENKAAIRNTLYWNPYVHPNENGEAAVSYLNSEVETTIKVTLEGVTAGGIPVVVNTYYTTEK